MVELGLYGIARVYWSMFGFSLGHRTVITGTFLALGALTATVGALFCFRERHLKRLLAFSTISHAGMFLTGIALLTPLGLAGAAVYVAGHALVKAALFLCVGIVLHRLGSVNETWLHGRGRRLRVTGVVFTVAGLGLADMPPFALFLGKGWIEESGSSRGLAWLTAVLVICSVLVGGAVLRVAGGVFYGLGDPPSEDPQMAVEASEETSETDQAKQRTPLSMIVPAAVLAAAGLVAGLLPGIGPAVQAAAVRFQDQAAYNATVLSGAHVAHPSALLPARAHRDHRGGPGDRPRVGCRGAPPRLARPLLAAPAAAAPRLRAGHRPGADHPPLPERGGQRLRDLDRDRRGLRGRNPGVLHPVTTQLDSTAAKWGGRRLPMTSGAAGCGDLGLVCQFPIGASTLGIGKLARHPLPPSHFGVRRMSVDTRRPIVKSKRLGARQSMSSLWTFQYSIAGAGSCRSSDLAPLAQ